jgi:hypothetical protein
MNWGKINANIFQEMAENVILSLTLWIYLGIEFSSHLLKIEKN